jgi:hypothetical protein
LTIDFTPLTQPDIYRMAARTCIEANILFAKQAVVSMATAYLTLPTCQQHSISKAANNF